MPASFVLIVHGLYFQPDTLQATGYGFQSYELHTGRYKLVFCLSVASGETGNIFALVLGQAQLGSLPSEASPFLSLPELVHPNGITQPFLEQIVLEIRRV